jgi:hypothetical protein
MYEQLCRWRARTGTQVTALHGSCHRARRTAPNAADRIKRDYRVSLYDTNRPSALLVVSAHRLGITSRQK